MNLTTKHSLKLTSPDAQALRHFLVLAITTRQESAYYQIVQLLAGKIVQKIHKKDLGEGCKIKLSAEESMALQIIIATNTWPGDDLDNVLYRLQSQLPPLISNKITLPTAIA